MNQIKLDGKAIKKAVKDIVTQSEIMTRAACPRKWYYRYALRLDKIGVINYHLIYGDLMHRALANYYENDLYLHHPKEYPIAVPSFEIPENMLLAPGTREEIELVRAKVQIAFDAYRWHYYGEDAAMEVISTEENYVFRYRGINLQGRIDLVASPKPRDMEFIWDFKTAGRFDATMLDAWSFRFQFLFYCWLYWKCTGRRPGGTMANGLAKSQLKPSIVNKKTKELESKEAYLHRIKDHFQANRPKYFYRQRMPLGKDMLERFENEMLDPHIDAFKMLEAAPDMMPTLSMAMNTGHCHVYNSFCEFLPLCKDGPMMLPEYQQREAKHVELEETA